MNTKFKLLVLAIPLVLFSCESDDAADPLTIERQVEIEKEVIVEKEVFVDREIEVEAETTFEDGFFVSAEGAFGSKNGSIAFVSNDLSTSTNFIYRRVNNDTPLAGLVQSVAFNEENAYVILNDVNTLVVTDKTTLVRKDIITSGLQNPRYMAIIGNKGYITNWGNGSNTEDDYIAILDLETNTIEATTIPLANGVEQIVASGNKLYVSHKGAFSTNNIISVVDIANSNLVETITVKDNPDELTFLPDGTLVVLSEGHTFFNADFTEVERQTEGAISFINTTSNTVEKELIMPVGNTANLLASEDQNLYYSSNGKVYTLNATADTLPTTGGIDTGFIYGMGINENKLYTVNFEFTSFSTLSVYDIETGVNTFSSAVGLGASKVYFPN